MKTWTPERDAELLRLKSEGKTQREIADTLGCFPHCKDGGVSAVAGRIHRIRHPWTPKPRPKREPNPNAVMAAVIVIDGGTYQEAMEETGLTWEQVRKAVISAKKREYRERREMDGGHAL